MTKPRFTQEQTDFICYQIGDWYLKWKDNLVNFPEGTHRLSYAKEMLKELICNDTPWIYEYRGWIIYTNEELDLKYSLKIEAPGSNNPESISNFNYENRKEAIDAAKTVIDFLMRKQ